MVGRVFACLICEKPKQMQCRARSTGRPKSCRVCSDTGPLIAAAVRHGKDQTGLMLDKCTRWLRLLVSLSIGAVCR